MSPDLSSALSLAMGEAESKPGLPALAREDLACVFGRDPAARSRLEVLLTYPGLHAILMHRLAHALWIRGWNFAGRWLAWLARLLTNVDIHPGARIGRRFFIDHGAGVVIGETAEIGDDCTLYHGVTLGGTTWNQGKRHPTLGAGVVVGAGAKILGAIRIGDAARIGANSVVIREVPAGRTAIGIPARLVGERTTASLSTVGAGGTAINLDHHLIPDPVGKAIQCLLDRIDTLETEVRDLRGLPPPVKSASCVACAAGELCCEEHGRG
ncbi:MAG: serine O-acetyltransferase [Rhodocyclaceae bacterium]|nr:MAG: serine O-acetyltransferase [Rhodocyclaceae bacterium]TND00531.1 MAG: serine O-acetyltransferase [Rhodocyclaceae bacterium]